MFVMCERMWMQKNVLRDVVRWWEKSGNILKLDL